MAGFQYSFVVGPGKANTWGINESFDHDAHKLYSSMAEHMIVTMNGEPMFSRAKRSDLWHAGNTRSNRIAYAGYAAQAVRLATVIGNLQCLSRGLVWRPASYPIVPTEGVIQALAPKAPPAVKRPEGIGASEVPKAPPLGFQVPKAPPPEIGPPPSSRAETPAEVGTQESVATKTQASSQHSSSAETPASAETSQGHIAKAEVNTSSSNKYDQKNVDLILVSRAQMLHEAKKVVDENLKQKQVTFSQQQKTIPVSPTFAMRPVPRSPSAGVKREASRSEDEKSVSPKQVADASDESGAEGAMTKVSQGAQPLIPSSFKYGKWVTLWHNPSGKFRYASFSVRVSSVFRH